MGLLPLFCVFAYTLSLDSAEPYPAGMPFPLPRYRMTWPMLQRGEIEITAPLSPLETNLMLALLLNRGRFLSTAELADCVWGHDPEGGPDYIADNLSRIVARMRAKGIRITNDHGIGYRLTEIEDIANRKPFGP